MEYFDLREFCLETRRVICCCWEFLNLFWMWHIFHYARWKPNGWGWVWVWRCSNLERGEESNPLASGRQLLQVLSTSPSLTCPAMKNHHSIAKLEGETHTHTHTHTHTCLYSVSPYFLFLNSELQNKTKQRLEQIRRFKQDSSFCSSCREDRGVFDLLFDGDVSLQVVPLLSRTLISDSESKCTNTSLLTTRPPTFTLPSF